MANLSYDYVIVGAGIVGLTTALALRKRFPSGSILVIEKESYPGLHASGRNSGVLHSGIYYAPQTLKAKVCREGGIRMKEFAKIHQIPILHTGKVIVATREEEFSVLDRLMDNAQKNGVPAERCDPVGIRKIEPHVGEIIGGIHCPSVSVIDVNEVLNTLVRECYSNNIMIQFKSDFLSASPENNEFVTKSGEKISYSFFINCGGAFADKIAKGFGFGGDFTLVPFKGIYFQVCPEKDHLIKGSIYPVPDPLMPFLGVHFTRGISNKVYVGPTAIPAFGRENYGITQGMRVSETPSIFGNLLNLFWKDEQNFRSMVWTEIQKYSKGSFYQSAKKLVRGINKEDLLPSAKVGIRPQLVNRKKGRLEMDFVLEKGPNSLHVLNAISPAFTSAFAFADVILSEVPA